MRGIISLVVSILIVGGAAYAQQTPAGAKPIAVPPNSQQLPTQMPSAPAQSQNTQLLAPQTSIDLIVLSGIQSRLDKLEKSDTDTSDFIKTINSYIKIFGAAITFIIISLGATWKFFWKKKILEYIDSFLTKNINDRVENELPKLLGSMQQNAEKYLLKLASILVMKDQGNFELALKQYGWSGSVADLRDEMPALRRVIIECLYASPLDRTANREAAWQAMHELTETDKSIETNRLFLKLSITLRKYEDGIRFFEKNQPNMSSDQECATRASTLYRKIGNLKKAEEVLDALPDGKDTDTVVAFAAIKRDLGKFNEVHTTLLPMINQLMHVESNKIPKGAHRLFNTFIANCIDMQHPEDAIEVGNYILGGKAGAVETFTVGRLALKLSKDNDHRILLAAKVNSILPDLPSSEASIRCRAIARRLDGNNSDAVEILDKEITNHAATNQPMTGDEYFHRCMLAEIYIEENQFARAIDVLRPAGMRMYGGEAKFLLAKAYSMEGNNVEARRWLSEAITEMPKWKHLAMEDDQLRNDPDVMPYLASMMSTPS